VGGDVSVDSEPLLMTDFMNFKIKSTQSFRIIHKSIIYIYVCIYKSKCSYSIYIYIMFLKNIYDTCYIQGIMCCGLHRWRSRCVVDEKRFFLLEHKVDAGSRKRHFPGAGAVRMQLVWSVPLVS
jgi:hypothetical protein